MSGPITVTDIQRGIQSLGIAGLKRIYTSADVSAQNISRDTPVLLPDPGQWLASSTSTRLTLGGAAWKRTRVLNYVCLVAEAGQGRRPADYGDKVSDLIDAIENALCDFAIPQLVTVAGVTVGGVGIMQDQSGGQFIGFPVSITTVNTY